MNPDRELNAYLAGGEHARRDVLDRLRELHQPVRQYGCVPLCRDCLHQWPCETRRILDEGDDQ